MLNAMKHRFAVVFVLLASILGGFAAEKTLPPLRVFVRAEEKSTAADAPRLLPDWLALLKERGADVNGSARFPTAVELARTDVLVLQGGVLAAAERKPLEAFAKRGGGIVALSDAISGPDSAWLKPLVGGGFHKGEAQRNRGLTGLYFSDYQHPITEGVANFDLDDESLFPVQLLPKTQVLASTFRTAKEIVPQMWTYENGRSRAFVALPGGRAATWQHAAYRGLILRGIAWAGRRPVDALVRAEETASFPYPAGGPTAPAEAAKKIRLQSDFELSLVAAEPLIVKPISIDWDPSGRMWVALTPEYPFKESAAKKPGRDSIVILEDTNHDGQMDKSRVFADGLVLPTSFVFHRDGVIVAQAPQILFLRDTDGDGKADKREVLFSGFGTQDTHAVINNLRWCLDGWIYGGQGYSGNDSTNIVNARKVKFGKIGNGIFRFKPDGSAMEQVSSYGGNSWGIDFSWDGELFFSKANGPHLNHVVMPERFLARGKLANATSDKAVGDHDKVNPIFGDQRHEYVQVAPVGVFTAASGCMLYEGGAWPERYHSSAFVSEPTVHILHEDILYRGESPTYEATRRSEAEFMAGSDLWFRPVHTRVGPDGAMYVLDFYNQAISHNDIRGIDHGKGNAAIRPDRDHDHGRIWRVQHKFPRYNGVPYFAHSSTAGFVQALQHPNAWVRLTAQRLLTEQQDKSVVPALEKLLQTNRLMHARIHALWTLHALGALTDTNLIAAINDKQPSVQDSALRLASELRQAPSTSVINAVVKQSKDSAERTRLDALCALTSWKNPGTNVTLPVHRMFPDIRDAWTKSAILGIARLAPTNFIRLSFASDRSDGYRELLAPLIEDIIARKDAGTAAWVVSHLARSPGGADKLKVSVLNTFNKNLGTFAPAWTTNLQAGLKSLLKAENRTVRVAAFPLASHFDKPGFLEGQTAALRTNLLADLANEKSKEEDRTALLASLMTIPVLQPAVMTQVDQILAAPKGAPGGLQKSAVIELGRITNRTAAEVILRNFAKLNTENRQLALGTLVKRSDWGLALVDALENGSVKLADLGVQGPSRLQTHPDKLVAGRANAVIAKLQGPQPREKDALITKFAAALRPPADVKNGKEEFAKNCAVCHKFGDKGKDLGPDLTGVGLHGASVLLAHILDPNRVVEGNFVPYNLTTKKQDEYTGLIKTENKDSVTLKNIEGEIEIRRSDIASLRTASLSLMPEGLEALGEKTIRDIIGYLITNTPKGFRALDLAGAFTADSRQGLYVSTNDRPSLSFKQYGIAMVDNIPFNIVNPAAQPGGRNVVVLRGGSGFAKSLPQRVEFTAGTKATKLYILGGVAGWGFPEGAPEGYNAPACRATLLYADGQTEQVIWKNGEEFASYERPYDVPGSRAVGELVTRGQLRWFTLVPKRQFEIQRIILESFDNHLAPTFVAVTALVE